MSGFHECDLSGLLRNYDYVSVGLLCYAYSGLVPHSVVRGDVLALGDRQGASRRYDPASGNNNRSVMQRGVLEEEASYESAVDGCIHSVASADDILQRSLVGNHDECAGLALRHTVARICNFVDSLIVCALLALSEDAVEKVAALGVCHVLVSELNQELSDFRLEYYNDSDDSHIHECVQERGHELHAKRADEDADEEKRNDSHKDAHRRRTSDPFEQNEDQNGEKQYVEDVSEGHLQKT